MTEMAPSAKLLQGESNLEDIKPFNAKAPFAGQRVTLLRCLLALGIFLLMQHVSGEQDSTQAPSQPDEDYKITLNADMVLLSATVVDGHNALVSGLRRDDFRLYEDGVLQPIKYFSHEDIPVTAGIVVDNSGSMGPKRSDVIASAMAFARSSNPQDQMFVVNFNERISFGLPLNTPFTDQPDALLRALSNIRAIGQTALYDGIAAALEAMACGVPVVASHVGGVSEVVVDGETGFLAAVGDVAGMARHARRLLTDEDLYLRMSHAARHLAETQFRLAPAVDRYEAVYRRVLEA